MSIREKFVIFDGNALVHRAWHALPPLTTRSGQLVNAAYGFMMIFMRVLKELKPNYAAVTFDLAQPTFRHKEFKQYKAQRVKQAPELYQQIPVIKELLTAFNVSIFEAPGYEADDVIGTVTKLIKIGKDKIEAIIVTGDLDTLQLIDDSTKVYTLKHGLSDAMIYDEASVQERYGLLPTQMIDFKALRGDQSDNIPGVKGIGEKTALELIKDFGGLDELYQQLEKKSKKSLNVREKLRQLLLQSKDSAYQSQKLVTIVRDIKLDFSLNSCRLGDFKIEEVERLFRELEFKSLLPKIQELGKLWGAKEAKILNKNIGRQSYKLINTPQQLSQFLEQVATKKIIALDTETTGLDPLTADLVGISLSVVTGEAYFITPSAWVGKAKNELMDFLASGNLLKCCHNAKFDWQILRQAGFSLSPLFFDTMIAAYLLRAGGERNLDLSSLVLQEFGYKMQPIEELIGDKGKNQINMGEVDVGKVAWYSGEDADFTLRLKNKLEPELEQDNLAELFNRVEMPLMPVLGEMELTGVKIDASYLADRQTEITKELAILEKNIHSLAGREFNINSPKQLKEILFDDLDISPDGLRRTKTGVSTAASELEKMRGLHPIIDLLFNWRELSKLLSTYVEALPELVSSKTGRVHTSFNQTVTATGRLSSSSPNLQNIPIKGDWGKKIRRAFVAETGKVLLSADYSQIELRIAAHLSQDKTMIEIFKNQQDIHSSTAAFIFSINPNEVTSDQRRKAKEVNFGVLYGMGAWGLSERTGISRTEAQDFISRYFRVFAGLTTWIDKTKMDARKLGFATTLLGRKRNLPEINSGVQQVRAQAERMAVNLPVQGTAADMMKVAMVKVMNKLKADLPRAKMILQVHDELVFEVAKEEVAQVAKLAKQEMESALALLVPIVVDVKVGDNWGEMTKLEI